MSENCSEYNIVITIITWRNYDKVALRCGFFVCFFLLCFVFVTIATINTDVLA